MPLIPPRTTRTKVVRHITQLYQENNEELFAYAKFIGELVARTQMAMLDERWREVLRSRLVGGGFKLPSAASANSRGGERDG